MLECRVGGPLPDPTHPPPVNAIETQPLPSPEEAPDDDSDDE